MVIGFFVEYFFKKIEIFVDFCVVGLEKVEIVIFFDSIFVVDFVYFFGFGLWVFNDV